MPSPDRKQKILDHLNRSVEKAGYLASAPQSAPVEKSVVSPAPEIPAPTPAPPPQLSAKERRRQILNHVQQSSGNFGDFSLESPGAKTKKMDHIRKSLG